MFCEKKPHQTIESMASLLILGGVLPLCAALIAQYSFNLPPCHFCVLQRYPYGVAILAGGLSLLVTRGGLSWRLLVLVGALAFLATGALGLYHTGIERGLVDYAGGCVADTTATDIDALRDAILAAPKVSCADATVNFLGLSMASWNSVFAFSMLILVLLQYRCDRRAHDQRAA